MRDLIESTLPRTYLSELDEEYGVVDVEEIVEALDLEADKHCFSATNVALQKKHAMMHVEGSLGIFAAYSAMQSEIEDLNDWRPTGHELRPCSLRTFCNRIVALQDRVDGAAGFKLLLAAAA
ncbi:hypothetical protein U8P80_09785 [Rhizobium beringeri]|uniref:hypothetical protein n=1 Tax=Rhizobium ruizarguesonis TaxID=2081791 RepID=UPI00036A7DE9|nr:hypothetical protein [Rhizobium ruizarguesonis]MCB2400128.1 hypothetical protein [Rhizobium ruizarguesonis]WSG75876.1 hypothetical protein U8P80_09785 [Rhizobium beringeri]WSH16071.1 hypothetical protein U8P74_09785 [Rhizobium beringeri]